MTGIRLTFTAILICAMECSSAAAQQSSYTPATRDPALKELIARHGPAAIALVLSGGGARGLAHIGVLDILDSAKIPIDLIVGTSMGAAIGGLYAAGYTPKQLADFAESANWADVLSFDDDSHRTERLLSQKDVDNSILSLRFTGFLHPVIPEAISSGERLTMLLNSMVINAPNGAGQDFITDLRLPFIALATDIVTGQRKLISHGDLTAAMRASITLPLRFAPLVHDTEVLVDGGLLSNIPVDVAKDSAGAQFVVVSNTTSGLKPRSELTTPWDVADQVITLMMLRLSRESLKHADAVIEPKPTPMESDFQNIPEIIESGRAAARAELPQLLKLVQERRITSIPAVGVTRAEMQVDRFDSVLIQCYGATIPDTVHQLASSLRTGRTVTRSWLEQNVAVPLLNAFRSRGYTLARVDSMVYFRSERVLELIIDKGRIGKILVVGTASGHPRVVTSEFPLSPSDVFRAQTASSGLQNLTSTGYFDFASIEIQRDTSWPGMQCIVRDNRHPEHSASVSALRYGPSVVVTVQERAPNVLRLGVFADNLYGAVFSSEIADEDFLATGTRISLKGGLGSISRYGALTFEAPRAFSTTASMFFQAYSSYQNVPVYATLPNPALGKIISSEVDDFRESINYGARLKMGGNIGRDAEVFGEIRRERQSYFSLQTANSPTVQTELTALKAEFDIDTRNDRDFPQIGTLFSGSYEIGTHLIGGENGYTKIYAMLEQAIPLSSLHTIIPKFQAGFGDLTLPRLEQFSLGGIESFYGLNEFEARGRQMISGSLTYQIAIPHALLFPTFVSMRYDLGATWLVPSAIKFEDLSDGVGIGIGLETPIGVVRFAIGENFRLNQQPAPTTIDFNSPTFYFSIGSNL